MKAKLVTIPDVDEYAEQGDQRRIGRDVGNVAGSLLLVYGAICREREG